MGIPAPSGLCKVGCVDLKHKLEGDEDSLLLGLFFPATADAVGKYVKWSPHVSHDITELPTRDLVFSSTL